MRRSLASALLLCLIVGGDLAAQILDDTLVPRGQLRLQAHPSFTIWSTRFGRTVDGTELTEDLGTDLTDPTGSLLFPGIETLARLLEGITTSSGYAPVLGSTEGRVAQEVTRIEFGGHVGVFDWLTIGIVVPWTRTGTALDYTFAADTTGGADLGLSPTVTNSGGVDGYLLALANAAAAASANAATACAAGPGAGCAAAQSLADRATSLFGSTGNAYAASPFFPMAGSAMATLLAQVSSTLDADLVGAGLTGIGAPMAFATDVLTEEGLGLLPQTPGAGIDGAPLGTRLGLWQTGDIEVSALIRVLERVAGAGADGSMGLSYRMTIGLLARLPTGTPEDPDVFLDFGTGDGQTDIEGRVTGVGSLGRLGLAVGGRYGIQASSTLTKRVAPLELAMPPLSTRQLVRWSPASYLGLEVAPSFQLSDELSLTGQYSFFYKGRDVYELVDAALALDPDELARETGMKLHQVGVGLRYSTVQSWTGGVAPRPVELHVRVVRTVAGSGGHTPISTRVEAGIRLFRRVWGPRPTG